MESYQTTYQVIHKCFGAGSISERNRSHKTVACTLVIATLKLHEELIHDDYLCRNPERVNDEIVH